MEYNLQYISPEYKTMLESALSVDRCVEHSLSCSEYKNATILPFKDWENMGCVIDEQQQLVKASVARIYNESSLSRYDVSKIKVVHKTALHLCFMHSCFGHWFTDNLSRAWFLLKEDCKKLCLNRDVVITYTIDSNRPLTESQLYFFDLLGINLRNAVYVDTPTCFDKVIIPEAAFFGNLLSVGCQYTKEMIPVWNNIIKQIPIENDKECYPEKIYFTRTRFNSGKDYGEKAIERTFQKLGYSVISPETLPLSEQLKLVRNSKHFATTEGSLSHMALFCQSNTHVEIISKVRWVNTHQLCVNQFADVKVTYIEAHRSSRADKDHPWWGPFYLCQTRYLQLFVSNQGKSITCVPDVLRPAYWKYTRKIWARAYNWVARKLRYLEFFYVISQ